MIENNLHRQIIYLQEINIKINEYRLLQKPLLIHLFHSLLKPSGNIGKINLKVAIVYIDRNRLVKSIYNRIDITLKEIDQNLLLSEIQYPIFTHSGFHILRQLKCIILFLGRWRNNFHKEIWCAIYAESLYLRRVTDNPHIRLNHSLIVTI